MENLGKLFAYLLELEKSSSFFSVRGRANNLYIGSKAIANNDVIEYIHQLLTSKDSINGWQDRAWLDRFESSYEDWIKSSKNNKVYGLENYVPSFSTGTTQGFDSFYLRHRNKTFKCLVGEYFYHLKSWISNKFNWSFISSINDLQHGDALVLSVPFCDTGNELQHLEKILLHCEKLSIPVLIDCCYYSISAGINYNFVYNCIDTITFSLSKTFPVSNLRIGVRYTRKDIVDGQTLHSDINYNHSWSAWIGYSLMQKFSPDFIYDTYKDQQNEICDFFNLKPSQSVIFACGAESWSTYNRSTMLKEYQLMFDPNLFNNRICLNTFYENWDLFTKFRMLVCR